MSDTEQFDQGNPTGESAPQATAEPASSEQNVIPAPEQPAVAAPEASQIGDDEVAGAFEPQIQSETDAVPAQVTGAPAKEVDEVKVHEVFVTTDEVITDTSDPRAVQIPDAGRGFLDLPIHALGNGTPEQQLARLADES